MSYKLRIFQTSSKLEEGAAEVMNWANGEFRKLELETQQPETRGVSFEVLRAVPARYKEGDLYFGAAGVFGGQAGLYIREGANWRKL
jgi:hypothetical protein